MARWVQTLPNEHVSCHLSPSHPHLQVRWRRRRWWWGPASVVVLLCFGKGTFQNAQNRLDLFCFCETSVVPVCLHVGRCFVGVAPGSVQTRQTGWHALVCLAAAVDRRAIVSTDWPFLRVVWCSRQWNRTLCQGHGIG